MENNLNAIYNAYGNKHISNSHFWCTCIRIEFEFINRDNLSRMCICICYKINSCESGRYAHLIQNRWCSDFITDVSVYCIRNSGPQTKECAFILSCWDGMISSPYVMQLLDISEPDSLPKWSDLNRAIGVRWLGVFFGVGWGEVCPSL